MKVTSSKLLNNGDMETTDPNAVRLSACVPSIAYGKLVFERCSCIVRTLTANYCILMMRGSFIHWMDGHRVGLYMYIIAKQSVGTLRIQCVTNSSRSYQVSWTTDTYLVGFIYYHTVSFQLQSSRVNS